MLFVIILTIGFYYEWFHGALVVVCILFIVSYVVVVFAHGTLQEGMVNFTCNSYCLILSFVMLSFVLVFKITHLTGLLLIHALV
jgi:hypothetical protein